MFRKASLVLAIISALTLIDNQFSLAQEIVTDGNTATIVTENGDRFIIDGNTLSADGKNLFHSFQEFGLTPQQIATFLTNPNIQNILTRISGGNPSYINGLIEVVGGDSNLYLMNPAGIIFGNGASLNVPADFTATTSTGIGFPNGIFNAVGNNNYQDLSGNPNSFIFNTDQPGSIINSGNLSVSAGKNINLVGGSVINTGTIETANGKINIQAVEGTSRVRLTPENSLLSLEVEIPTDEQGNLLSFTPLDLPTLLTGGNDAGVTTAGVATNDAGKVEVSGQEIADPSATAIASGNISTTSTTNQGGEIKVLGEQVGVIDAQIEADGATGGGEVLIGGDFQGQGTIPNASTNVVDSNSTISANALDDGNGGTVVVWSDGDTDFQGNITTQGGANSGDGGLVEVSGKQNLFFNGQVDTTAVNGQTGTLLLDPINVTIVDGDEAIDDEQIADNEILAGDDPLSSYTISENVLESLSGTNNVIIEATNNITIQDLSDNELLFADNVTTAAILPGNDPRTSVTITADSDNSGVGSFNMNASDAIVARGRNVNISGVNLNIGSITTATPTDNPLTSGINEADGNGGDITLDAQNNITINGLRTLVGGGVASLGSFVSAGGSGDAGTINVNSANSSISISQPNGDVIASTDNGQAGSIDFNAPQGQINLPTTIKFFSFSNSVDNGSVNLTARILQPSGTSSSVDFAVDDQVNFNLISLNTAIDIQSSTIPQAINFNNNTASGLAAADNININQNINTNGSPLNITANGSIDVTNAQITTSGGDVAFTSDADSNLSGRIFLDSGSGITSTGGAIAFNSGQTITTGNLDSSNSSLTGGAIDLNAQQNITLGTTQAGSSSGNGSAITINTPARVEVLGTFTPQGADTFIGSGTPVSNFVSPSNLNTNGGDFSLATAGSFTLPISILTSGGDFNLTSNGNVNINSSVDTDGGDITVSGTNILSSPLVFAPFDSSNVNNADGGDISLTSNGGNINVNGLFSDSTAVNGTAGDIDLSAILGNVTVGNISAVGSINGDLDLSGNFITQIQGTSLQGADLNIVANNDARINNANVTGDLIVQADRSILVDEGANIVTSGGDIVFNADADEVDAGNIIVGVDADRNQVVQPSNINANGGDITFGGGSNPLQEMAIAFRNNEDGILLENTTLSTTNGDINLRGQGLSNNLSQSAGISLIGNTSVTTIDGDLNLIGEGLASGQQNNGIALGSSLVTNNAVVVESTGSGNVNLTGDYNGSGANVAGMSLFGDDPSNPTRISSNTGTITLDGNSSASANSAGIALLDNSQINSTGGGNININASSQNTSNGFVIVPNSTPSNTAGSVSTSGITTFDIDDDNLLFSGNSPSNLGTINIISAADVSINDIDGIDLGDINATGTFFNLSAGGDISDSGTISVGGTTNLSAFNSSAGSQDITLDSAGNDFNVVNLQSANNVTLVDINDLSVSNVDSGFSPTNISLSGDLQLQAAGETTIEQALQANSLTTGSSGITLINGGEVDTTEAQTYNNPVLLGQNTILNATDITFNGDVDSFFTSEIVSPPVSLTVNTLGTTVFNGDVGNNNPLESLSVTSSSSDIAINGQSVTTVGDQTYNNLLILGQSVDFDSNNFTASQGIEIATGTASPVALTINANDSIIIGGQPLASSNPLANLISIAISNARGQSASGDVTIDAVNDIDIQGAINTAAVDFDFANLNNISSDGGNVSVTTSDGDISVDAIATFGTNTSGDINLLGNNDLSVGPLITFLNLPAQTSNLSGGIVDLQANEINITGEVTAQSFNAVGDVDFAQNSSFNPDISFLGNTNVTTIDGQIYQGEVNISNDIVLTSNLGEIDFEEDITSFAQLDITANESVTTQNITSSDRVRITSGQSVITEDISISSNGGISILSANRVPIEIDTGELTTQNSSINLNSGAGTIVNRGGIDAGVSSILLIGNEIDLLGGQNSVTGTSITFLTGNSTQNIRIGDTVETDDTNLDLTVRDLNTLTDGFSRILVSSGNFASGSSEPIDLFILQDLSGSFDDDLNTIQALSLDLVDTLLSLQPDTQFGVGTFSGSSTAQQAFRIRLPLTSNTQEFISTLESLRTDFGADETQLFALQQSAVRADRVGFRPGALRYDILFTDEDYFQPTRFNPSVGQVNQALTGADIEPIFAVTASQIDTYQDLANQLGRGQVVQLSSDSSNLIEAIVVGLETSNPGQGTITIVDSGSPLNIKDSLSLITAGNIIQENTVLNVDGSLNLQGANQVNTLLGTINTTDPFGSVNITSNNIIPGTINSGFGGINLNGNINLQGDAILTTTGDINFSDDLEGAHDLILDAGGAVTTQNIDTSGQQGGDVTITASDDVEVTTIKTNSSAGVGGDINVETFGNFRATGFTTRNVPNPDDNPEDPSPRQVSTNISVDASGSAGGGNILIDLFPGTSSDSEGGSEGEGGDITRLPFVVGADSGFSNGTAGIITNSNFSIPPGSYISTQVQGNITVRLLDEEDPFIPAPEINNDLVTAQPSIPVNIGALSTLSSDLLLNTSAAKEILVGIEKEVAEKPAFIYVSFTPEGYQPQDLDQEFARRETANTQDFAKINVEKKNLPPTVNLQPSDDDILDLLIITGKADPIRVTVPVTRQEVVENAGNLWNALADVFALDESYKPYASNLYEWLIEPIETQLAEQEITNLLFILPTEIRFTPIAALYDQGDEKFLVEKYSSGLAPSLNLNNNNYRPVKELSLLAMGASDFEDPDIQPLPAAGLELPTINQIWNQEVGESFQEYINQNFTLEQIQSQLDKRPYGIVHFGTHGEFNTGEADASYIQLYNSKLGLDQVRNLGLNNPLVELMVLSACETAFGDEISELGFAGLAVRSGVKTALGSVWQVSDTGTLALMTDFYQQLRTQTTKAEALRQAQLNLLQGNVYKTEDGNAIVTPERQVSLQDLPENSRFEEDFSHPFYWAPFTMIGNPW